MHNTCNSHEHSVTKNWTSLLVAGVRLEMESSVRVQPIIRVQSSLGPLSSPEIASYCSCLMPSVHLFVTKPDQENILLPTIGMRHQGFNQGSSSRIHTSSHDIDVFAVAHDSCFGVLYLLACSTMTTVLWSFFNPLLSIVLGCMPLYLSNIVMDA